MSLKQKLSNKFRIGKAQDNFVFDETTFDLKVDCGTTQSTPIKISATMNIGQLKGKTLELNCKWFNKTNLDIKEIVGVTGQMYQPSLMDVGTIIHVQCMPILVGKEYEGMPIIKDIGPLVVDKETEEEARQLVQAQNGTFFINIASFKIESKESKASEGFIRISGPKLTIEAKNGDDSKSELSSVEMCDSYPNYVISRVSSKEMKIELNPKEHVVAYLQDNIVRDVLCLVTKMMVASKIVQKMKSQDDLSSAPSTPAKRLNSTTADLLQLGQLTKQNKELLTQKQALQKKLSTEKAERQKAEEKLKTMEQRMDNFNKNYFSLEEQVKKLTAQKSSSEHHYTFMENQVKIARAQCISLGLQLETTKKQLEDTTNQLKMMKDREAEKPYENMKKQLEEKVIETQKLNSIVTFLTTQKEKLDEVVKSDVVKMQELQNQIAYHEKKYALLVNQKMEQLNGMDNSHAIKAYEERQRLRQRQMLKLQEQLKQLIEENNEMKISSPKKQGDSKSKKPKKSQMVEVQKVANRLAEAITEKDLINQQLKDVNKQLIEKVAALQKRILIMEQDKLQIHH